MALLLNPSTSNEVYPFNGPLMLIPKSHKHGVLEAGHDTSTTSYPLWTLDEEPVEKMVEAGGLVVPTGKPGGVLMLTLNCPMSTCGKRMTPTTGISIRLPMT